MLTKDASSKADILWFLPTHGDGRYLGTTLGGRDVNFNYLRQIAQAADQLGYFGVLLPTGRSCEDSWVIASAVAPWTERLRYLVAVRPGLQSPSVAARMTATLDRISNGRLLINVVTGGDPVENKGDGIFLDRMTNRYAVTRGVPERLHAICSRARRSTWKAKHIRVEDGRHAVSAGAVAASAARRRIVRRRASMSPPVPIDKYRGMGRAAGSRWPIKVNRVKA